MAHDFDCMATGIGSLPHTDPELAAALALRHLPEAPFWPQLPKLGFREGMDGQYAEGLPGLVVDEAAGRVFLDLSRDRAGELARFYEAWLAGDPARFAISEAHAAGLAAFERTLRAAPPARARFLKGHVTGPLTAGLLFKDAGGAEAIHDEEVFDALVKLLGMKAAWQVDRLGAFGKPVIIFVDEPAMESLGSAFSSVAPALVAEKLEEVIAAVHARGGLAGIHCCGNADWPMIFGTKVDIVNFDAYGYLDRVLLYPREVGAFLARGGALAWGVVPTGAWTGKDSAADLAARVRAGWARLEAAGVPREELRRGCIVTPSCGMGSLDRASAEAILATTAEVSRLLRGR